jgi:hypothetical protein
MYVHTVAERVAITTILPPSDVAMFLSHNHNGRSNKNYELKKSQYLMTFLLLYSAI